VESVVWVTERKGLLSAFFVLLSILSYLNYALSIHKKRCLLWFYASLLLFIFALMSKPMAVTLPATLLLLDIYPLKRTSRYLSRNLNVFLEKIPFFILSIASGIVTIIAEHSGGAIRSLQETNLTTRMLNALVTLAFYMEKLIWPSELIPFYPFTGNLFNIQSVVSGMFVLFISSFSLGMARQRKPLWLIAWLYYVITLLPTLGIIQIGGHAAADRFTYLPSLSIFLLFGIGVSWLWVKANLSKFKELIRGLLLSCVCVVIFLLSHLTIQQIWVWENSEALWSCVIKAFPKTVPLAHYNLGLAYYNKGMLDEAISEYKKTLTIDPNHTEAHYNLGLAYDNKGMIDEAISEYKKALIINPHLAKAHNNLGLAYVIKGRLDESISEFKKALAIKPNYVMARANLAAAYSSKNMFNEAIAEFKKTLAIDPNYAKAHYNLGLIYDNRGMLDEAIFEYNKAIAINPNYARAHYHLGITYYYKGNYRLAILHCDQARELGYSIKPELLELLKPYR
jgi:tetratricopeptide (TPR) repeat protein